MYVRMYICTSIRIIIIWLSYSTLNNTFIQCIAGSRGQRGIGPVVFTIDNSVTESEGDFSYVDDPQVFSLRNNQVIKR